MAPKPAAAPAKDAKAADAKAADPKAKDAKAAPAKDAAKDAPQLPKSTGTSIKNEANRAIYTVTLLQGFPIVQDEAVSSARGQVKDNDASYEITDFINEAAKTQFEELRRAALASSHIATLYTSQKKILMENVRSKSLTKKVKLFEARQAERARKEARDKARLQRAQTRIANSNAAAATTAGTAERSRSRRD